MPRRNGDFGELKTLGNLDEQRELLQRLDQLTKYEKGAIEGKNYDDWLAYFLGGTHGEHIRGIEAEQITPVGMVSQPSPLDATSAGYLLPLLMQGGEELIDIAKPAEVSQGFMDQISIAKEAAITTLAERGFFKEEKKKPEEVIHKHYHSPIIGASSFARGITDSCKNCGYVNKFVNHLEDDASHERELYELLDRSSTLKEGKYRGLIEKLKGLLKAADVDKVYSSRKPRGG